MYIVQTGSTLLSSGNYGGSGDNRLFTFDGANWVSPSEPVWQVNSPNVDAYSYYPYSENVTEVESFPFSVTADQSAAGAYAASDFLWSKASNIAPKTTVNLPFSHRLSKVKITLAAGAGVAAGDLLSASVEVRGTVADATINLSTGVASVGTTTASITPKPAGENVYEAIVIPQTTASTLSDFIVVAIAGKEYSYKVSALSLIPSKQHNYAISVKDNDLSVTAEGISGWENNSLDVEEGSVNTHTNTWTFSGNSWPTLSSAQLTALSNPANRIRIWLPDFEGSIPNDAFRKESAGYPGLSAFSAPKAFAVGTYAFYCCKSLVSVTLSNVVHVGEGAFSECSSLSKIALPKAKTIGIHSFSSTILVSADFPLAETIDDYAFHAVYTLQRIHLPEATTIGQFSFANCRTLVDDIYLPQVRVIDIKGFSNCNLLARIDLPEVRTLSDNAFNSCPMLTWVKAAKATKLGDCAFWYCRKLAYAELPSVNDIGDRAFDSCSELTTLILTTVDKITLQKGSFRNFPNEANCVLYLNVNKREELVNGNTWGGITWLTIDTGGQTAMRYN